MIWNERDWLATHFFTCCRALIVSDSSGSRLTNPRLNALLKMMSTPNYSSCNHPLKRRHWKTRGFRATVTGEGLNTEELNSASIKLSRSWKGRSVRNVFANTRSATRLTTSASLIRRQGSRRHSQTAATWKPESADHTVGLPSNKGYLKQISDLHLTERTVPRVMNWTIGDDSFQTFSVFRRFFALSGWRYEWLNP